VSIWVTAGQPTHPARGDGRLALAIDEEAPPMTLFNGRAARSVVLSSARSRSFVPMADDGEACRPPSLLTPERLRP
jgi:hypothetical protein